jgi:hypothetical protein
MLSFLIQILGRNGLALIAQLTWLLSTPHSIPTNWGFAKRHCMEYLAFRDLDKVAMLYIFPSPTMHGIGVLETQSQGHGPNIRANPALYVGGICTLMYCPTNKFYKLE